MTEELARRIENIERAALSVERMLRDFLDMVAIEMRQDDARDSTPLEPGEPK